MAYRVVPDRQGIIQIGKIKENLVTEVELPAPGFGGGSYAVLLRRPKEEQPYPVTARHEGGSLVWTVRTADTAIAGTGKLECRWYGDNGEVAKSQTYMVRITDGLPDPTEAPEAWEGFMGQVARDAQAAQTAAGEAKANADGAAASAGIAQGAATEAGKLARAAGEAANAAAAAASAASSAQAGAESAERNARAAAEAAETARSGAEAAKLAARDSATGAAGSAEAAAQAAQKGQALYDQVKDDLAAGKLKGEKGDKGDPGPQGPAGKDAPQIDDGAISRDTPWSSRQIIDTLCPKLEETGNPVVCYPVAGYPLGVVASWEPTQAGSGEPSPDNIRPISGRENVSVERCGENLMQFSERIEDVYNQEIMRSDELLFLSKLYAGQKITLTFTVETKDIVFVESVEEEWRKRLGFECHGITADGKEVWDLQCWMSNQVYNLSVNGKKIRTVTVVMPELVSGNITFYAQNIQSGHYVAYDFGLYAGTTAPTAYTPYEGDTLDLQLPGMVYGGSVDAVTGDGKQEWEYLTFDGAEAWFLNSNKYICLTIPAIAGPHILVCSHFPSKYSYNQGKCIFAESGVIFVSAPLTADYGLDGWKAYLAAQAAAGTPVQIAYKLATPTPFTATGNGPIMPIPGETNTVITDVDTVIITGRADPAHAIAALQAQLAVATQQLEETQAAMVDTTAMAVDYIYEQDSKIFGGEEDDSETDAVPT